VQDVAQAKLERGQLLIAARPELDAMLQGVSDIDITEPINCDGFRFLRY